MKTPKPNLTSIDPELEEPNSITFEKLEAGLRIRLRAETSTLKTHARLKSESNTSSQSQETITEERIEKKEATAVHSHD